MRGNRIFQWQVLLSSNIAHSVLLHGNSHSHISTYNKKKRHFCHLYLSDFLYRGERYTVPAYMNGKTTNRIDTDRNDDNIITSTTMSVKTNLGTISLAWHSVSLTQYYNVTRANRCL